LGFKWISYFGFRAIWGFVDAHDAYNVRRDPMIAMATVLRPTSTPDDDVSAACRGLWMFSDGMMAGEGRRV
ncbi:MAG: hypothetical protein UCO86_09480, partial [Eggerthella lenta]|nr:hypothetical protein [Eggerthella lenta]